MAERARGIVLAQTNAGDVIPSGTITVREPGTSTSISETIYVNDDPDASEYTNGAFFTGADGLIVFYLEEAKRVDVLITKSGYSSVTYPVDVSFTANRFLFRGAWSGATAYAVDDVVTLSGSTYIAIQAGTNQNPSTETAYWTLMAEKGAAGGLPETLLDAAGDIIYASADDTAARLAVGTTGQVLTVVGGLPAWVTQTEFESVATSQATSSTSYTDLATAGPAVTYTVPASGKVIVTLTAALENDTVGQSALMSVALSGANTVAGSDNSRVAFNAAAIAQAATLSAVIPMSGLTPGSTTFTAKYRATGGSAGFAQRRIIVQGVA